MKKKIQIALILGLVSGQLWSQNLISYFDYKVFQVPNEGILIETYFDTKGNSVVYEPLTDSTWQANIQLQIIVSKGEGIKDFRKESISSPIATGAHRPDFLSTQRFLLPKGVYTFEIEMKDLGQSNASTVNFERTIDVNFKSTRPGFSDIELLAGFKKSEADSKVSKAGLDMLPMMSTAYGTEFNELLFYFELYGMDKEIGEDKAFLLTYFLEDLNFEKTIPSTEVKKRKTGSQVVSEMGLINLQDVPTGSYNLRLEARTREQVLIASKEIILFRENLNIEKELSEEEINSTFVGGIIHKDTLVEYIYSLRPITAEQDRLIIDHQLENFTLIQCKSFLYSFWETRNPINPSEGWAAYKKEVELVEDKFGTSNKHGYETDMGRVYLTYGAPNSVLNDANNTEMYPFQIWHYYKAGKFNDKRFVFYDPELINREYTLLHSDIPGEVRNPRWNIIINSRNNAMWNVNQNSAGSQASERLQQLYDSPR